MAASFLRFLDHIQGHTTVGRTSLNEGSVRRRDSYLAIKKHIQETDIHVPSERLFLYSRVLCTSSVLVPLSGCFEFCLFIYYNTIKTSMHPAGPEPIIPASDRPQILALECSDAGIGGEFEPATLASHLPQNLGLDNSAFGRAHAINLIRRAIRWTTLVSVSSSLPEQGAQALILVRFHPFSFLLVSSIIISSVLSPVQYNVYCTVVASQSSCQEQASCGFYAVLEVHACPVTLHGRLTTNSSDTGTVSARHFPATVRVENPNGCTTC